jgi:hypothetical protein
MMPESPNPPPISPDELIKIKHRLDPGTFERAEVPGAIVLVIRSGLDYPDIVNDVEAISDELELDDIEGLTDVCLMGDLEIIGLKLEVINAMMEKRVAEDEIIVKDLRYKLDRDFGSLIFESEQDAHKKLRLGIRLPMELKAVKSNNLPELMSKVEIPARKARVVYIIGDDGFIRIFGPKFYEDLTEFVAEQTPRTIEEEQDIQKHVRGGMADHFVDDEEEESSFQQTITEIEEEVERDQVEPDQLEVPPEPVPEPTVEPPAPTTVPEQEPEPTPDHSTEPEPSPPLQQPQETEIEVSNTIDLLRNVLNKQGYSISTEVLQDVDIIANPAEVLGEFQRESQIFIKFIIDPSLRDMINFEKVVEKYNVKFGIIVTPDPNPESKVFAVGKKLEVVAPEDFEHEVRSI